MLELNKIYCMDCLEGMKQLDDNSVDSIVTDPPYELGFMGKAWDSTGIAYNVELWKEALRVLKPGGHLLAFGGTRTYHRMACAIEDAGFEIRDQMQWIYGSGFPKSMDISKAIDKAAGAEREVVGICKRSGKEAGTYGAFEGNNKITSPATPEAKQWQGWGTALKPANEPICVARKPISESTVADNVLKWGTGGINIDGCRIGTEGGGTRCNKRDGLGNCLGHPDRKGTAYGVTYHAKESEGVEGRFPANVILDEEAGRLLDEQSGISKSKKSMRGVGYTDSNIYGVGNKEFDTERGFNDSGGASRFFYCAKASKGERGEGNNHPTVKPIKLIEYLVTLVTPKGGICLDPFEGSGTHALACMNLGVNYIGFELSPEYCDIAEKRIAAHAAQLRLFQAGDMP